MVQDFGDKPGNANPDVVAALGRMAGEAGVRKGRGEGIWRSWFGSAAGALSCAPVLFLTDQRFRYLA